MATRSLHPAGKAADDVARPRGKPHQLENLRDADVGIGNSIERRREAQVLQGAHFVVQRGFLGEDSDARAQGRGTQAGILAEETNVPAVRPDQAADGVDQGCLAGTVGPDDAVFAGTMSETPFSAWTGPKRTARSVTSSAGAGGTVSPMASAMLSSAKR
jgi:hypothetical protein